MKKQKFRLISAAAALCMLLGCGTYAKPAYADDENTENDAVKTMSVEQGNGPMKVSVEEGSNSNSINPTLTITNTSSTDMDLTGATLKYYYTEDGDQDQTFNCYYAGTVDGEYQALTSYVQGKIVKMDEPSENADCYMEVTFNGGTLAAGQSAMIQLSANKSDWSDYDKSNDYSYNDAEKVAGYLNYGIVWGSEADEKPVLPEVSCGERNFYESEPKDIVFDVAPNTSTLVSVNGLAINSDYTVSENKIIIRSDYLSRLSAGSHTLEFAFTTEDIKENINIVKAAPPILNLQISSDSQQVKQGDEISIPVKISGLSEEKALDGVNVTFKYDTSLLENVSIEPGEICVNSDITFVSKVSADGTIKIFYADSTGEGLEDITKDGTLFTMKADVRSDASKCGPALTAIDSEDFYCSDESEFHPSFNFGDIVVTTPYRSTLYLTTDDVTAYLGERLKIPVRVSGLSEEHDLCGANFKLKYDKAIFENVKVTAGDICVKPNNTFCAKVNSEDGTITVFYADDTGEGIDDITKDGVFMNIEADVKATASYPDTIEGALSVVDSGCFTDKNYNEYDINFKCGTIEQSEHHPLWLNISSDEVDACQGETINIPIKISGIKGTGVDCACFSLKYDTNVLENVSVEAGDICINSDETLASKVNSDTGIIKVFYADTTAEGLEDIAEDGVFVNIKATVKNNAFANGEVLSVSDKGSFSDSHDIDCITEFKIGNINIAVPIPQNPVLKLTTDDVSAYLGETINVPVKLSGLSEEHDLCGVNFKLKYDPSILENVRVTPGDICVNPDKNFSCRINKDGTISIFYADMTAEGLDDITKDGVFMNIQANVKTTVGYNTIKDAFSVIDSGCFTDKNYNEFDMNFKCGTITLNVYHPAWILMTSDDVYTSVGYTITMPIKLSALCTSPEIDGACFKLKYDTNVLEDVKVCAGDICSKKAFSSVVKKADGVITVFFADSTGDGTEDIRKEGIFMTITAKVKDNAEYGESKISLVKDSAFFASYDEKEYTTDFNLGSIHIDSQISNSEEN